MVNPVSSRLRQAARTGGFVVTTAAMLPAYLADASRFTGARRDDVRERWVKRWARALLALFAVEAEIVGALPPPTKRGTPGRLVVANHRSAIDIGVLLATFGGRMVSRADLSTWPLVGAAARSVGTVFVDRASTRSGAATIRAIQRELEDGQTVSIFPEGTTFEGDTIRPLHGGAFIAAARAGAEVLPVGLAYPKDSGAAFVNETFLSHLGRMAASTATRMVVAVGAPIPTRADGNGKPARAADVTARAQDALTRLVEDARRVCGP